MKYYLSALFFLCSSIASADFTQSGSTVTFTDSWWQVERRWPENGVPCKGGSGDSCTLENGEYKWVGASGEGYFSINSVTDNQLFSSDHFHRVGRYSCFNINKCNAVCPVVSGFLGIPVAGSCEANDNGVIAPTSQSPTLGFETNGRWDCETTLFQSEIHVTVYCEYAN